MTTYPNSFYYSEKNSKRKFRRTPPGILNPVHLAQGKPCWQMPNSPNDQKPRKLILSDWTAASWDEAKIRKVQDKLAELQKKGFKLYIWQAGKIEPLNDLILLSDPLVRVQITPELPKEVKKLANQQNKSLFTESNTHVLDDYQLALLLGQDPKEPRSVNAQDVYQSPHSEEEIKAVLKAAVPPVVFVITPKLNETAYSAGKLVSEMANNWFGGNLLKANLDEDIQHIDIEWLVEYAVETGVYKGIDVVTTKESLKAEALSKNNTKLNSILCNKKKYLEMFTSFLNPSLQTIHTVFDPELKLDQMTDLKELFLTDVNNNCNNIINMPSFKRLESLGLEYSNEDVARENANNILMMLGAVGDLTRLRLSNISSSVLNKIFKHATWHWKKLEVLDLSGNRIDSTFVKKLHEIAPNLKTLGLCCFLARISFAWKGAI